MASFAVNLERLREELKRPGVYNAHKYRGRGRPKLLDRAGIRNVTCPERHLRTVMDLLKEAKEELGDIQVEQVEPRLLRCRLGTLLTKLERIEELVMENYYVLVQNKAIRSAIRHSHDPTVVASDHTTLSTGVGEGSDDLGEGPSHELVSSRKI